MSSEKIILFKENFIELRKNYQTELTKLIELIEFNNKLSSVIYTLNSDHDFFIQLL
jgi:hypothetical protein